MSEREKEGNNNASSLVTAAGEEGVVVGSTDGPQEALGCVI